MTINFKLHSEVELPQEVIDDAPKQGEFDWYAEEIFETYDLLCEPEEAVKYLKTIGAWDTEELQDHGLNLKRLLWLSVMDCWENKTNFWYMGG